MSPTKTLVLGTDPQKVLDLIEGWKKTAAALEVHAETYKGYVERPGGSYWEGAAADAAQDKAAQDYRAVSGVRDEVDTAAQTVSNTVTSSLMPPLADAQQIIANAESHPGVTVNEDLSMTYDPPPGTSEDTAERNGAAVQKAAQELRDAADRWWAAEEEAARQIKAMNLIEHVNIGASLYEVSEAFALAPGEVRNLGPVAGTGAKPGVPGIGAVDLGEVVRLPDGSYVAVFGDSFEGDRVGADPHYPSVAVPVTFDELGRPTFGEPLTGPKDSANPLFVPPPQAQGKNTLPAGSIQMRDGTTFMLVAGTDNLDPTGGSWLVEVTNDPANGWTPIEGSWAPPSGEGARPTQISGYQGSDGKVYIAANSFDRSEGVTMYRVDPENVTNRHQWQPWTGDNWGDPNDTAMPVTERGVQLGELSFREVEGKAVLSGFNVHSGPDGAVEIRVADDPTQIFDADTPTTVAVQGGDPQGPDWVPQNYGGYILPGSTLDSMNILVSQWGTALGTPYNAQQVIVNVNPSPK